MADIPVLVAQQRSALHQITHIIVNLKKLGREKVTETMIRRRIQQIEQTRKEFIQRDAEIQAKVTTEVKEKTDYFLKDQISIIEDASNSELDELDAWRVSLNLSLSKTEESIVQPGVEVQPAIPLPKMELPSFTGVLAEWPSFRDRFTSLIKLNKKLTDDQRMHYLTSALSGEARNAVRHLDVRSDHFEIAWKILLRQYDNERELVFGNIQRLLALPPVAPASHSSVRMLRESVNIIRHALIKLNRDVDNQWSDILVYIITQRLDPSSREAWETVIGNSKKVPSYAQLDEFLETRVRILQSMQPDPPIEKHSVITIKSKESKSPPPLYARRVASLAVGNRPLPCFVCEQPHMILKCDKFAKLSPNQRIKLIERTKRCYNCLSANHSVNTCPSEYRCRQCKLKHHTLLHLASSGNESKSSTDASNKIIEVNSNQLSCELTHRETILLATARVHCYSSRGRAISVRALLDQGSEATLISENLVKLLRLSKGKGVPRVRGVSEMNLTSSGISRIRISPTTSLSPCLEVNAIIVKSLINYAPHRVAKLPSFPHLHDLTLADPEPLNGDAIDLLIGADLYSSVFLDGVRRGHYNEPIAQETIFGWIISGPIASGEISPTIHANHISVVPLESMLRRFWELEDVPSKHHLSEEEIECEEHFTQTHHRLSDGRYVVRFPFKGNNPPRFANSQAMALSSLYRLERRFERDPEMARDYRTFMSDYENLGHMRAIDESFKSADPSSYYIPHHAVMRDSSITTRLRVVFNASTKDSSGRSLNDCLHAGPRLQIELPAILIRWRLHQYVLSADIEKMFRQILINPADMSYQKILWRSSSDLPVRAYALQTVTYGTTSAPYQALRVLKQLVLDDGHHYPLAASVINHQTYVDDLLFGADDRQSTIRIRNQTISLLEKGGFNARKWAGNDPALLINLDPQDHGVIQKELQWDETVKILGITWKPTQDHFQLKFSPPARIVCTKRGVLSVIAKLFDPFGWLTPIIIVSKIMMQELWQFRHEWDEPLSGRFIQKWNSFMRALPQIEEITIPRWTAYRPHHQVQLHGFADASVSAYAAVVYLRISRLNEPTIITLIIAKSRVAPTQTQSIPRLELCAAVLLSRLMLFVRDSLSLSNVESFCWSDSMVTLTWLSRSPSSWKTFVANRVAKAREFTGQVQWRHVPTRDNPADVASRGVNPTELKSHPLWWTGPHWLKQTSQEWPAIRIESPDDVEIEASPNCQVNVTTTNQLWSLRDRFSSWSRLIRITAMIIKFSNRLRRLDQRPILPLLSEDLQKALTFWIKDIQQELFQNEIAILKLHHQLPQTNSLSSLTPYLDDEGILRTRGRLRHSVLSESAKYPILLRSHPLVKLLIAETHEQLLHSGPLLTLSHLRHRYWILRARPLIRQVLYRCVKCTREKACVSHQLMGDLPDFRVTPTARAFVHTGVDYAGPLFIRLSPGRGFKTRKAYIAVFICMVTKATHLELVSDCSTNAFLAAYQRFVSRRGQPTDLYSDNGTVFHGADRKLAALFDATVHDERLVRFISERGANWHFIPPAAPHFGGLWEAAVRSLKYHLRRCTSSHKLTFEELTTLLCKIEAVLNSRPLSALTDCMDDYLCLTPGHFLVGSAVTSPPEPSLLSTAENRLSRWQLLQRINEQFWHSWRRDYLHTLRQRPKWRQLQELVREGQIVLLHENGTPPSQWSLGRIVLCHPGPDGITRVVTVKTQHSLLKRPISKLSFLPVDINSTSVSPSVKAGGNTGSD